MKLHDQVATDLLQHDICRLVVDTYLQTETTNIKRVSRLRNCSTLVADKQFSWTLLIAVFECDWFGAKQAISIADELWLLVRLFLNDDTVHVMICCTQTCKVYSKCGRSNSRYMVILRSWNYSSNVFFLTWRRGLIVGWTWTFYSECAYTSWGSYLSKWPCNALATRLINNV